MTKSNNNRERNTFVPLFTFWIKPCSKYTSTNLEVGIYIDLIVFFNQDSSLVKGYQPYVGLNGQDFWYPKERE